MKFFYFLLPILFLIACGDETKKPGESPKVPLSYFQGELHYQYDYTSDSRNVGYIKSKRPGSSVFKYDLQHYQSIFYGADEISYYYSGIANRAISSTNGAFNTACDDYGIKADSLLLFKKSDTDVKIQGQACQIIEFQTAAVYTRYHVSKEVFLAPDTYQKHTAFNWAFYGQQSNGGIILKAEYFFDQFNMIGELAQIVPYTNGERAWDITETAFENACR